MKRRPVNLIDKSRTIVAAAKMADENTYFGGTIDLASTPPTLRALFDEFEEAVNDQIFSLADEIQAKVGAYGIKARFDDGFEADLTDLQVFPSTGEASFKLVGLPAKSA